jgi:hypothetical protein
MICMLSRSSAAHRARSRVNAAAKDSARAKMAHAVAASRARLRRLYHVERLTPSASQGCFAGRLGPMPCALRQRCERKRSFSRRSASVIVAVFRVTGSPVFDLHPRRGPKSVTSPCAAPEPEKRKWLSRKSFRSGSHSYQDAIAAGRGVTEYASSGKAADEIRALWAFVDRKTRNRDGKAS